jgi:predicted nucleic acid-binding protein
MRTVFADTFYFIAQFNPHDRAHAKATAFTRSYTERMLTTDWVMVELGDAFAQVGNRSLFVAIFQQLQTKSELEVLAADRFQLQDGLALYTQRTDKDWSLTDCISFATMTQHGLTEALTGDHHFEQAGFTALLK